MTPRLPSATYRFHARLVDYAGTFPPAKLPVLESVVKFLRHRVEGRHWMLGRLVLTLPQLLECPYLPETREVVGRLSLREAEASFREIVAQKGVGLPAGRREAAVKGSLREIRERERKPFSAALIASAAPEAAAAAQALRDDLAGAKAAMEEHDMPALVDTLELRLPADIARRAEAAPVTELLRELHRILEAEAPAPLRLFVESTTGEHHAEVHEALVAGIAEHLRHAEHARTAPMGFKLRTGGTEAAAFPPVDVVARAIAAAARAGVAMKATAGLHHPVRHHDEATGAMMHGFLNVFGAAVLAHARGLSAKELEPVIAEEDGKAFAFSEEAFAWRERRASAEEVARARKDFATSFGCCDFEDPVKGLKKLGILD